MTTTKYTPGPWEVTAEGGDSVYSTTDTTGADIICLSPMSEGWVESAARWPANARLIAAAPALLEACDEVFKAFGDIPLTASNGDQVMAMLTMVRAIKLARGEP